MTQLYPGLYRGTVSSNVDPLQLGRLQVQVPGVPGASSLSWALPCAPFGGKAGIGGFALPPVGANVWIKHENHTPIGAFKARSTAIYFAKSFQHQPGVRGVITATRGNHGQAVGLAARRHVEANYSWTRVLQGLMTRYHAAVVARRPLAVNGVVRPSPTT